MTTALSGIGNALDEEGRWSIDTRCIACDVARHWAPDLIGQDIEGKSFVARQPANVKEEEAFWLAAVACPTQSIHNRDVRRPTKPAFPHELTPGVLAMGHNARSSFGAHSYLVIRPEGNILTDSPRFQRPLAEQVDGLGGIGHILLTHRDDVADADRWADRYGAKVWIHEADSDAAPYATDIIRGDQPTDISAGVVSIATPGHTKGHLVFHVDDRWLFTGDTLHWNQRRNELDVTPKQTFYSWDLQADSMDTIAQLRVEWVFAGHGMWHHVGADSYASQMRKLGPSMRRLGQTAWSLRPGTSFAWY